MRPLVEQRHDGGHLHALIGARSHQGTDIRNADIGGCSGKARDGVGRAATGSDLHLKAGFRTDAFLETDIDRRLVAARQPVELKDHLVSGGCRAGGKGGGKCIGGKLGAAHGATFHN